MAPHCFVLVESTNRYPRDTSISRWQRYCFLQRGRSSWAEHSYGCRVTSIGQDEQRCAGSHRTRGGRETVRGDDVVSVFPFLLRGELFHEARLSPEKQRAIRDLK